jgi:cytochrome c oxidase assembly protein subunit 11
MTAPANKRIQKQLIYMLVLVAGMFAFCFALVPIYNVFCKVTGLNGKTPGQVKQVENANVDLTRTVTVQLISTLNESMPGEFSPKVKAITLHPGEYVTTSFWVKNLTNYPMIVQAIPSVSPGLAAEHLRKIECFCFIHQPLEAREGKEMPLVFTVDPALPKHIQTLTLAYTLFDVTQTQGEP